MSLAEKKENLLHIVEDADEKLTELLIELAEEYNAPSHDFSEEELNLFKNRRDEFYKNNKQGYSVEEAHDLIRKKYHESQKVNK